jgi:TetR/AcrR family transcriptional repressor of nem operon
VVFGQNNRAERTDFMGRKLEFNYDQALDRATRVFWAKGYAAASMRDLLKAMRIGEGSFYHLFKGKRQLYLECLKHYNADVTRKRVEALASEPSIKKAVRAFFHNVLEELENPRTPRVCLLAQSVSADVMEESELGCYVKEQMAGFEKYFYERLEEAKKSGELPEDFQSEVTAGVIVTYLQGFFRVVHVLKSRQEMWRQIDTLLNSLGL